MNFFDINYKLAIFILYRLFLHADSLKCVIECPESKDVICAFDIHMKTYTTFPSECAMAGYAQCRQKDYIEASLKYCINKDFPKTRRMYGESCPVFCPSHYRPVCAASKYRSYAYRTFTNACYLDMINCRGDDDFGGYEEVPLSYCQRHLMKNIFKERIIMSDFYDSKRDLY